MNEKEDRKRTAGVGRTGRLVHGVALVGTLIWLAAIFLAPLLRSRGAGAASGLLYAVFAPVCHQIPSRCLSFHGYPLAVCARCLGIYAGFLAGLAAYPLVRRMESLELPEGRIILLAALPMGLDFLVGAFRAWPSPSGVRLATGLVWGSVLPFYVIPSVTDAVRRIRSRRAARPPSRTDLPTGAPKR
ncbi:MAG TPA: DUF2085 domain-containing protein [Desulfobaccales bacterium]|nr:DUF2085 domain-containing protein [Desulfobaccales bacterium]